MVTEPDAITTRSTVIWSEGLRLAATVVAPAGRGELRPAILLCHGWGGLKQHLLNLYADYFARAGYIVLAFDYRTWGESDGKPVPVADEPMLTERGERTLRVRVMREVVDPVDHVTDARAAFAYLIGEAGVDQARMGLFGTSYGAGHVLCLAGTDDRVRAVVAQIGGYGHPSRPAFVEPARQFETDKARGVLDPPIPQRAPDESVAGLRGAPDMARQLLHSPIEMARVYDEYLEPARELALNWFNTHLCPQ